MVELSVRDQSLLLDLLLAARDARTFVAGMDQAAFLESRLHQNAVIRSLEVIGETAGSLSAAARATLSGIAWTEITGMRHRLIHGYADVDLTVVWSTVAEDLDPLIAALAPLIPPEEPIER
jgi:uncharacterized protein with HEPN domain